MTPRPWNGSRNPTDALPDVHEALLVLGGIGFALVNALCKEWLWRGMIQSRLTTLFSTRTAVLAHVVADATSAAIVLFWLR